ncbi:MAG TPA: PPOX class F420-dependent oxidoreductase [Terriglobales bacterium]|nr:PPOX class F420-dependent oxidoreductase [Terriglobales bacterium]
MISDRESYISLATFRKNGQPVWTPVWFAMNGGRLYVMTRSDSWKIKRLANNPRVLFAPSSIRGKIKGPQQQGMARIMPPGDDLGRTLIRKKYLLARLPIWSKENVYLEITPDAA